MRLLLEPLGTQKRDHEIDAKDGGDEEAEKRFKHLAPSEPVECARIERQHKKHARAEREKDEVGHVRFSC
ncbi:hypothetical protein [Pseudorhizobium pelagicum]|uniref:hypothetical protein n=1 Tax=Pseudorhizobium pelagicum TaxID=1509405 RepID=UPI000A82BAD1|nr:hypothetical protein [Pseudorhizobium pelagicum]